MPHLWQWLKNHPTSAKRLHSGSNVRVQRNTGFTSGSFKEEAHCTSTIACTLLIPLCVQRYYYSGKINGTPSYRRWELKQPAICGYERTGHTTGRGTMFYRHTHRRYVNQLQRTWQATVPVLKINIAWTTHAHTTRPGGGGAPEPQQNYSGG